MNKGCYACKHCEIIRGKPLCNGFGKPFKIGQKQSTTKHGHCRKFEEKDGERAERKEE